MKEVRISQVDVLFSNGIYPIEFLFYYKEGFKTEKLRRVLRGLSSIFWPMFGEYEDGVISFDKYREEDCYDEEVVHQELDLAEIDENRFETYSRFRQPDLKKLFFLKVIRWKNGMALIPKLDHLAGDGYSYFYFLSPPGRPITARPRPIQIIFDGDFFKTSSSKNNPPRFCFRGSWIETRPPR